MGHALSFDFFKRLSHFPKQLDIHFLVNVTQKGVDTTFLEDCCKYKRVASLVLQ